MTTPGFTPTVDWQFVPPGCVLPPGLEIRMDMASGRNQARLPQPDTAAAFAKANPDAAARGKAKANSGQPAPAPAAPQAAAPEISTIDFAALPDVEPPPRRFIVDQWWPAGIFSSLYGPPTVGKSFLAQLLSTCVVTRQDFFGFAVEQGPVLGLFAEDDDGELKRRQWRINQALGLKNKDLAELHLQGRAGTDNCLITFPSGAPDIHDLFDAVIAKAKRLGAIGLVLDNRAQMILGNENDRMVATAGGNLIARIAHETGAATLLLGHPAKAAESEYSGSTAWDAVTRSRWLLRWDDEQPEEGDAGKPRRKTDKAPGLTLSLAAPNYAARGAHVELAWRDGVLRATDPARMTQADFFRAELRRGEAVQAFLNALSQFTSQGRPVSHSRHAHNYAPRVFLPVARGFSFAELRQAMEWLFTNDQIAANAVVGQNARRQNINGIARVIPPTPPPTPT